MRKRGKVLAVFAEQALCLVRCLVRLKDVEGEWHIGYECIAASESVRETMDSEQS